MIESPFRFARPPHLAMVGLIGAGKSTMARSIATRMQIPLYPEGHSPYLPQFYRDMETYASTVQFERFAHRLEQATQIQRMERGGIQDRSHWEDLIFAKCLCEANKMKIEDFDTFYKLMNIVPFPTPTALIFLRVTPSVALGRIKERGIACEQSITLEYLQRLYDAYEIFIQDISKTTHVIVLEWNDPMPTDAAVELVVKALAEARNISLIDSIKK
jgi:deoxyadenosine kinase